MRSTNFFKLNCSFSDLEVLSSNRSAILALMVESSLAKLFVGLYVVNVQLCNFCDHFQARLRKVHLEHVQYFVTLANGDHKRIRVQEHHREGHTDEREHHENIALQTENDIVISLGTVAL